jgi:hypothetical protein
MTSWLCDILMFCDVICDVTWLVAGLCWFLTQSLGIFQVQVDPKARTALYRVCRPRWKRLSPCPCQVLSMSLAVCCSGPRQTGRVWVSGPYAVAAFDGRPLRPGPVDASSSYKVTARCKHIRTTNNWCVSSLDAIAKNMQLIVTLHRGRKCF